MRFLEAMRVFDPSFTSLFLQIDSHHKLIIVPAGAYKILPQVIDTEKIDKVEYKLNGMSLATKSREETATYIANDEELPQLIESSCLVIKTNDQKLFEIKIIKKRLNRDTAEFERIQKKTRVAISELFKLIEC
ncbi:hypothetical protein FND55_09970 [Lactobacillus paracasei subsp. paracasei]|uniref:hypothetical protein n=1 Tax=Lacticaseibacillus paracasei TaxID=1597 RepID=UPI0018C4DE71|nr:hypothetical protein [Lacticaseibacillus paracasei]MBG1273932.1 hypothetical protein [Lacticaseibacillus paracasei subsp. paracasei]